MVKLAEALGVAVGRRLPKPLAGFRRWASDGKEREGEEKGHPRHFL